MSRPRLVLDTNLVLSALLFRKGAVAWLRSGWQSEMFLPLVSRETVAELIRVLAYPKFALEVGEREDLLADYLPWCETITTVGLLEIPACRDPFDRPFLQLALEAGADALVTGDMDLLCLKGAFSVPFLNAVELRERLGHSAP